MTIRRIKGARMRAPLTQLESEVMRAVWDHAPCPVETVYQIVSRKHDLKETSVRTILRRLEQKGYLRHKEQGRAYVYEAVELSRGLAARAVRQIIDSFCKGSVEELVSGMVEAKVLSETELNNLENYVRGRREGSK